MSTGTWLGDDGSEGVAINSGRYVQYNLNGNIFEVSRKYVPLRPVGRGASGIVWYVYYKIKKINIFLFQLFVVATCNNRSASTMGFLVF